MSIEKGINGIINGESFVSGSPTVKTHEYLSIDEKYYSALHSSGLEIYLVPKKHSTTYALFAAKYGSVDSLFRFKGDSEFTRVPDGVAHFLEHKLFENENGEDTFSLYAKTGASANAFTSFDRTAYLFSCTSNFEESLDILLDSVTHPYFSEKSVEKEQGIIGQEIRMYDDNPNWQMFNGMLGALYSRHSVRLDIAGTVETIAEITPEVLYKCYKTFYNLNNMVLCVSGDVTMEQILASADRNLKKAEPFTAERYIYDEPAEINKVKAEKKLKVSIPIFGIGIKDTDTGYNGERMSKKNFEFDIINEMIFGKSGAFYSRLYDNGLINSKFSYGAECKDSYSFIELSGESKNPDTVFGEIRGELRRLAKSGLDRDEFERCKRVVYARSISLLNSVEEIANVFASAFFDGYCFFDVPRIIGSITFNDVVSRFELTYRPENCVISIINPIGE